jgi:hypothetical protein
MVPRPAEVLLLGGNTTTPTWFHSVLFMVRVLLIAVVLKPILTAICELAVLRIEKELLFSDKLPQLNNCCALAGFALLLGFIQKVTALALSLRTPGL